MDTDSRACTQLNNMGLFYDLMITRALIQNVPSVQLPGGHGQTRHPADGVDRVVWTGGGHAGALRGCG